jgi:hypothetical protein
MFEIYRRALADLGFEIFDVPVEAFLVPNATHITNLLAGMAGGPICSPTFWRSPQSVFGTTRRWN